LVHGKETFLFIQLSAVKVVKLGHFELEMRLHCARRVAKIEKTNGYGTFVSKHYRKRPLKDRKEVER
jgi:hypothetical protein